MTEDERNWPAAIVIEKSINIFTKEDNTANIREEVINIERFSNINRLYRATSYVFRFIKRERPTHLTITASELRIGLKQHKSNTTAKILRD